MDNKARFEELKAIGYVKLNAEQKEEYQKLKASALEGELTAEKESEMAEIKTAPDEETVKMSDVKLLINEINNLKKAIGEKDAVIKNNTSLLGAWREVAKKPNERIGRFRKWRENSDEQFQWIIGYRWFQKKYDQETKQWDNYYYLTLLSVDGAETEKLFIDSVWSKIIDVDEFPMTDETRRQEEFVHPSTPTVKKKKLIEDSTKVSGYRVEIVGDVPALVSRETISYNVHFGDKLVKRIDQKFINM